MRIDRYASMFLWLAAGMLFMFAGAIVISVSGLGIQMPSAIEQASPSDLASISGFEDPGFHQIGEGRYEVYMTASAADEWAFDPAEITIPVGSEVTFFIASTDVLHSLKVYDTTINVMIIPGQVAEVTYTFKQLGDFEYYCNEYCGSLHHQMAGVIHVVEE
jgi:cytochrome c oxidase subunit II